MNEETPELWDVDGSFVGGLFAGTRDEAVREYLDEFYDRETGTLTGHPDSVDVTGYVQQTLTVDKVLRECPSPLEAMLEWLHDEYGGPDEPDKPTESMIAAEREFIAAAIKGYRPWQCEEVSTETINVREWCAENEPGWVDA